MATERVSQKDLDQRDGSFTRIYSDMTDNMLGDGWLRSQYLAPILASGIISGIVLEVGSGPGYLGLEWIKSTEGTSLKCLDIDNQMIASARRRAISYGLTGRIEYIAGDASCMPFEDGCFDAVFSNCSLHEWKDPKSILSEINRVLKLNGLYCLVDLRRDMKDRVKQFLWLNTRPVEMRPTCLSAIEASYTVAEVKKLLDTSELGNYKIDKTFWGVVVSGRKEAH